MKIRQFDPTPVVRAVISPEEPALVTEKENPIIARMNDERPDLALDKHAVHGADEGLSAIGAPPKPFADGADVEPMRGCHRLSPKIEECRANRAKLDQSILASLSRHCAVM
jgi:hypothetical protein